jgi:hypothetical protein
MGARRFYRNGGHPFIRDLLTVTMGVSTAAAVAAGALGGD